MDNYWKLDLIFFVLPTSVDGLEVVAAIVGLLRVIVLSLVFAEVGAQLLIGVLCGLGIRCVPTSEAFTGSVAI